MNDKQIAYTISILQQEAAERDKRLERLETAVLDLHDRVGKLAVGLACLSAALE